MSEEAAPLIIIPPKRKVGRPKKEKPADQTPVRGIIHESPAPGLMVYLVHHNTETLKKLFQYFLQLSEDPLECIFGLENICFYGIGNLSKNKMKITIDAKKAHLYYCRAPYQCFIPRSTTEIITKKIHKNVQYIGWVSSEREEKKIFLSYKTPTSEQVMDPSLINITSKIPNINDFDRVDHVIKFEMTNADLKQKLSDVKLFNAPLIIRQSGKRASIEWIYTNRDGLTCTETFIPEAAKIESRIGEDEIFSITVDYKSWLPVASSAVLDGQIQIYLFRDGLPIITRMSFDDSMYELKVLTSVENIAEQ